MRRQAAVRGAPRGTPSCTAPACFASHQRLPEASSKNPAARVKVFLGTKRFPPYLIAHNRAREGLWAPPP